MMVWVFFFFFNIFIAGNLFSHIRPLFQCLCETGSGLLQGSGFHSAPQMEIRDRANLNEHGTKEPSATSSPLKSK